MSLGGAPLVKSCSLNLELERERITVTEALSVSI